MPLQLQTPQYEGIGFDLEAFGELGIEEATFPNQSYYYDIRCYGFYAAINNLDLIVERPVMDIAGTGANKKPM